MPVLVLQLLQFVQSVLPDVAKVWREIHSDDPAKANWTDAEAIADLIANGDAVSEKWATYIATHP